MSTTKKRSSTLNKANISELAKDSSAAAYRRITVEEFIRFAHDNHGRTLRTLSRKRPYRIFLEDEEVIFRPESGTPFYPNLAAYVSAFNKATPQIAFKASYYRKELWCNSYFVSTAHAMLRTSPSEATPPDLAGDIEVLIAAQKTERAELIKSRLGQGKFRAGLMKLRRDKCYVTGITNPNLLRASHIKPWRDSTNTERLDPNNGLLLTPLYDHLFDQGLITFANDGTMLISPSLSAENRKALGINPIFKGGNLGEKTRAYLAYHRTIFTRKQKRSDRN